MDVNGETTIFYVKIGNHPIETTIYKWLALGFLGFSYTSPMDPVGNNRINSQDIFLGDGAFEFHLSKVVSTHLWNTPLKKKLTNRP